MKLNYLQPHIEIFSIEADVIAASLVKDEGELGCTYEEIFGGEWQ